MTTINQTNFNHQVSFGQNHQHKAAKENDSSKNTKLVTGAKILGALAITGGAIYGAINLAKRGKAINNSKNIKYFGTPEIRKAANAKEVEEGQKIVKEMQASKARSQGIIHQNRQKALDNMDWDMKPMTKQEILEEIALKKKK